MSDAKTAAALEAAKYRSIHRRARRGLVASYIHELSERHSTAAVSAAERPERLVEQPQGG
jgi:hypothetical protein